MLARTCALALLLPLLNAPAFAEEEAEKPFPRIDGEISLEIGGDFDTRNAGGKINDTYPTIEMGVGWLFTPSLSVQGGFVFEPVLDPEPGETRAFDDLALYVEEFYGQYETGPVRLFAGKFNPTFGIAWDKAPGVYGVDMAEDYQLTERIGFGGAVAAESGFGKHTLTSSVFFVDTTALSDSFGARRGRVSVDDGGIGNTEQLDNFNVTLDGEDILGIKGLGYHAGYRHQAQGTDSASDENGWVAGLNGEHEMGPMKLGWIAEYVTVSDWEGTAGVDAQWLTLGGSLGFDRYNAAVSYTKRDVDAASDDYQLAFSVGTEIHDGWALDLGYKILEEEDERIDTVGFRLNKSFEFSSVE